LRAPREVLWSEPVTWNIEIQWNAKIFSCSIKIWCARNLPRQAPAYADAPVIKDPLHLDKLVEAVRPAPEARVLEIATGPGHVALAFARVCREVVGVDLTEAPLKIANTDARGTRSQQRPLPVGRRGGAAAL